MLIFIFALIFFCINFILANRISLIRDISTTTNTNWSANLSGVFHSSLVLGDINNDGLYDMISMGCTAGGVDTCTTADKIRVYINNGTIFNENLTWEANTTNLGYGSLALGDINNDGKLDLIALGDKGGGIGAVKVYINNGTTFNENLIWESNLSNVDAFAGSVALGDINNDGKLDLALVGAYPSSNNGIYLNNGTCLIRDTSWLSNVPYVGHGLGMGSIALGDINNDGKLDLVFSGSYSTNFYDNIYRNNGTSLIGNSNPGCDPCALWGWPSITLGDYDNDNDLDLAYMGTKTGDWFYIYNNTNGNFTQSQAVGSFFDGSVAWGDYDNDGKLDLAAMGKETGRNIILNNSNTYFFPDTITQNDMKTDNMQQGSLSWMDVDNDTNLDLIINGKVGDSSVYSFKIYLSNASLTKNNTKPTPPALGFTSSYLDGIINLSWGNGSDVETNTSGLYYNLMVGNSTTNNTIVSGIYGGSSNPTAGYFGNMMQRKSISLDENYLSSGTYYWYVQTIDTGLQQSNWSAVQSLVVGGDIISPSISAISSSVTSSTATIAWTTDETSNSSVYHGTTTATSSKQGSSSLVISHSIQLTGLTNSTLYYYNVSSCDYFGNCNVSSQYSFTTSETPVTTNSPGGGGSGGSSTTTTITDTWTTYPISEEQFTEGYSQDLKTNERVSVSINGETHYIGIKFLTDNTATISISSNETIVILGIGEESKADVNNDNYYDIYVKLNSIISNKSNITIKNIHEEIPAGKEPVTTTGQEKTEKEEEKKKLENRIYIIAVIAIGIIISGVIYLIFKLKKRRKLYGY